MTRSEPIGLGAVALATTAFSWGFILVKLVPLGAAAISFWRLVIASLVLSGVALALRTPWPARWGSVVAAGVVFGVHQLVFIAATKTTSIAIVTLLGALQPLLISVASRRVVGEAVPRALGGWSVLAVAGVAVVVFANLDDASRSLGGDLLALLNVVVFSAYFLMAKRARLDGAHTLTFTAGFLASALLVVAPALWISGQLGDAPARVLPTGHELALLAILALGPGNGHLLLNWAHTRVRAALASLLLAAVPLLASLWAYWIFDEPYGWPHLAGFALVATAVEGARRSEVRFVRQQLARAAAQPAAREPEPGKPA